MYEAPTNIAGSTALWVPEIGGLPSIEEDVLEWQPGERLVFERFRWPFWCIAPLAALAAFVLGGVICQLTAGSWGGFLGGILVGFCGTLGYLRPKRLLVVDSNSRQVTLTWNGISASYPFSAIESLHIVSASQDPVDKDDPMAHKAELQARLAAEAKPLEPLARQFGALFTKPKRDRSITLLRALARLSRAETGGELEWVARWLAISLDVPFIPAEYGDGDQSEAAQQIELGRMTITKAKFAVCTGADDAEQLTQQAIAYLAEANRLDPENVETYYEVAKICKQREDLARAIEVYAAALAVHPEDLHSLKERAHLLQLEDRYLEAVHDYSRILELEPEDHYAYQSRGNSYFQLSRHEEAVADYSQALAYRLQDSDGSDLSNSFIAGIYEERAEAQLKLGKLDEALADVDNALRLDADRAYSHNLRAEILRAQGDFHSADDSLGKAWETYEKYQTND